MNTKKIFECKKCGCCCAGESTISITQEDIANLAKFLGITEEEFLKKYAVFKHPNRIEMKTKDGFCIFFDKESRLCTVHPAKPKRCREWPLIPIIFKDKENFEIIKSFCLGLKDFSWEEIKNLKT